MLSRTADGLFWMSRYIERAENLARLLEAGNRLDQMPATDGTPRNEWSAILIAAGCRDSFNGDPDSPTESYRAIRHLTIEKSNPSSILACFELARANARAQRGALTGEVWTAVNGSARRVRELTDSAMSLRSLRHFVDEVRAAAGLFRGAVESTQLRTEGYNFIRLGEYIERADATARLLDVKYHVLLPQNRPVGSSFDQLQWNHLLRAAGARAAYRWVYHQPVQSELVIDLLVLNEQSPRSLSYCFDQICRYLDLLEREGAAPTISKATATETLERMRQGDWREVISFGLHQYLTDIVKRTNTLAAGIGQDFGFGGTRAQPEDQTVEA